MAVMEINVEQLSLEQLKDGIFAGTFLTDKELEILNLGRALDREDTKAIEKAYAILSAEGFMVNGVDIEEEIRDMMYEYAYSNDLEFGGGKFWQPSSC